MSETDTFLLPDLGEGLTEAEVVAWHVGVGDRVVAGQPLVSVETDKAVVEIPAPQSGVIGALHAAVGERLPVGSPLVSFGSGDVASVGVVGQLAEASPELVERGAEPAARQGGASAPSRTPAPGGAASAGPAGSVATAGQIFAAPAVRRLASELGVDLASLHGTGPGGVIVAADVRGAAMPADSRRVPVRGPRRAMAQRMADAHARVVPATVTGEADIQAWAPGTRPLLRLIRAVAAAAATEPRLNASFDDARWELLLHPTVELGIAMETDDGLFVPVLGDAGRRPPDLLAREVEELEAAVRARTIAPERLRGQTISLSNFGAVAGWHAAMVVVPPQVAIVGAGRAAPRVVAVDDRPAVHRVLPLSLTIDHRVITGIEACRFLAALIADLERSQ